MSSLESDKRFELNNFIVFFFFFYLSYVCRRGSNQLLQAEDVIGRSGDEGGSSIDNNLATTRTERTHTLHGHTET